MVQLQVLMVLTPQAKNAILLVAKSGTLTGNVITSSAKEATCNANSICVLPTLMLKEHTLLVVIPLLLTV